MRHPVLIVALAVAAMGSAASAAQGQSGKIPAAVTAAVANPARPDADRARDVNRKPAEVVAIAGIKPGDKVADLLPGGGYYTRIFAATVGAKGKVYAVTTLTAAARPGGLDTINAVAAANPNVSVISVDMTKFAAPEPLDVVWTSENYHDLHNGPTADIAAFNKAVFAALKPGGVFFVEDHNAKAGSAADVTSTLHRIEVATAKREILAAGFKLETESDVLKNPADAGDLPVREGSVQGHTDKFVLKFRKPK
jgi:predicted methyltransferase